MSLSAPIIAALRQHRKLTESLLHTAQELAHRASLYGVVRVSYSSLALGHTPAHSNLEPHRRKNP